jgi:hypothetical protein
MQTSLPLLIVRLSILDLVKHFSIQPLSGEMKCLTIILLPCSHHLISMLVMPHKHPTSIIQATWSSTHIKFWLDLHEWYEPLHSFTWPHWSINHSLACSSPLPQFIDIEHHSLPFIPATWSFAGKPRLDLPPPSHLRLCHVSYSMSSIISTSWALATCISHFSSMGFIASST